MIYIAIGFGMCMGSPFEHPRPDGHDDITFDIAPDGRTIVFNGVGTGRRDLYLFDMVSGKVTNLTSSNDYELCPAFSKDGRRIVFTKGASWVRADQLCVMDVATRKVEQLTDADENVSSPVFFPDGKRILCTVETKHRWGGLQPMWNEGGELRVVDIETRKQVVLKTPDTPVFSPQITSDGKWMAWCQEAAYIAPIEDLHRVEPLANPAEQVALNTDATIYATADSLYLSGNLSISKRTGNDVGILSPFSTKGSDPVFSADGRYVYFMSGSWTKGDRSVVVKDLMRAKVIGGDIDKVASYRLFERPLAYNSSED